jgi:hypothetical protein
MHQRISLLVAAALLAPCFAVPARAEAYLVGELGTGSLTDEGSTLPEPWPDFGSDYVTRVRAGYRFGVDVLRIAVEGAADFALLPSEGGSVETWRGLGGMRVEFGRVVAPGAYGHVGYGELKRPGEGWITGPTFDAGLSLDLLALEPVTLGLHGDYNWMLPRAEEGQRKSERWVTWGIHAGIGIW